MLTDKEQKLAASLHRRRAVMIEDLRRVVAWQSGPVDQSSPADAMQIRDDGFASIRRFFQERLNTLGAATCLHDGAAVPLWLQNAATQTSSPTHEHSRLVTGLPRILLCGHLDTVHPIRSNGAPWTDLSRTSDDRRASGPGCMDMKGGLIIMLHAVEALDECGLPCSWTALLNSDEETGSFASSSILAAAAQRHDVGLALEPALPNGGLVTRRGGSGQFHIVVRGRSAHVGRDFKNGISAVNKLARVILQISDFSDPASGMILNVGPIDGGSTSNTVPERARAWGNMRCTSTEAGQAALCLLQGLQSSGPLPTVEVHATLHRPPKPLTDESLRVVDVITGAALDLGLGELPCGETAGVCDGNNLQAAGLPCVDTLGVCGGGAHTTDEWIDLESMPDRAALLAITLYRLSQSIKPTH